MRKNIFHFFIMSGIYSLLTAFGILNKKGGKDTRDNYYSIFSFIFGFLQSFTQDLAWGKVVIIYILCIYVFVAFLGRYFAVPLSILSQWKWPVSQGAFFFFCISYRPGLIVILLMCLSFLIITKVPLLSARW